MKLFGQAMLVFGAIAFFFAAALLLMIVPSARTMLEFGLLILFGLVTMAGAVITIRYALLKDHYPELLLEAHKRGAVFESGGVKMTVPGPALISPRSNRFEIMIIVENATDATRHVTLRLNQLLRISMKQSGNISFPCAVVFTIEGGEVVEAYLPIMISETAATGRYIINIELSAQGETGRRMRQRQGYSSNSALRTFMALGHYHLADSHATVFVTDDTGIYPAVEIPPDPREVRLERIWAPGMPAVSPVPMPEWKTANLRRLKIVMVVLAALALLEFGGGVRDSIFMSRCQITKGKIEGVVDLKSEKGPYYRLIYSYQVGGTVYRGEKELYDLPPAEIKVYFDPVDPSRSDIYKKLPAGAYFFAGVFAVAFAGLWVKYFRRLA